MMRRFTILIALTIVAAPAQASLMETLFPSLKKRDYNPYETMTAPFASDEVKEKTAPQSPILTQEDLEKNIPRPADTIALDLPHTAPGAIERWVVTAVSDALSHDGSGRANFDANARDYFTAAGWSQFNAFLLDNGISKSVSDPSFIINSVVKEEPLLTADKPVQGRYMWFYDLKMLMSFLPKGTRNYESATASNYEISATAQLVRVSTQESARHDILINGWKGVLKQFK